MPRKNQETGIETPANKQKGKKRCTCCRTEQNLTNFYLSYSPMYSLDKRVPICKECCHLVLITMAQLICVHLNHY